VDTKHKLLIVDDDPNLRKTLSDILKVKGYAPIAVATGQAALDRVEEEIPAVALVDLRLEDMSGLRVVEEIKKHSPVTECILLTGYASQASAIEAVNLGAYSYVQKPYDMEQLLVTIRRAIEKREAAEALRRRNRELALLNQASQALTATLDLGQVFVLVLEEARRLLNVTASSVWLIEPETGELVCRHSTGPKSEIVRGWRLAPGEGLVGWVAGRGESLIVPDVLADERHFRGVDQRTGLALRSILSVPLRIKESVIGVLQAVDTEADHFAQTDLTVLEMFATTGAISIENAGLYQELHDYAEQLEQRVQERTAQLQAQYARLDAILRNATDGIVVTNAGGEILQANPVAQTWLTQTLSPEEATLLRETVCDLARRAEEQPEAMLELTGLDLQLNVAPISEAGLEEAAAVVDIHDVSHLKALNRMKSHFISNISHEFRTPITTIKLYATLIRQQPEKWAKYLDAMEQETERLIGLVEDILQISHIDAGRLAIKPRPTALNELTEEAFASHQVLAQDKDLTLEHYPAEPGPVALIDPQQMMQALNNLVRNAIQYTPAGGMVTISTGKEEAEGRVWAALSVADTGMGISEKELPHTFERFFRGEKPQLMQIPGTGLGLAIVKEIVELHGGRVMVESQVDVGSTFTAWLPVSG
jgi:two-component system NtrC family sensor kinase